MRVSIITVVHSARTTISDALWSVLAQTHQDLEYIVIDGASVDGTLEVLREYQDRLDVLVSEPDQGIYDALNKGIGLATGEVVGLLHADDRFAGSTVVEKVAARFADLDQPGVVYGDLDYIDRTRPDRVRRRWRAGEMGPDSFRFGWMPPHPAVFVRRELFHRHGLYDLSFGTAADYEILVRLLVRHRVGAAYLPLTITEMRTGGASGHSLSARLTANRQDRRAWSVNGLEPAWFTRWAKPVRKLGQYVSALDGRRA